MGGLIQSKKDWGGLEEKSYDELQPGCRCFAGISRKRCGDYGSYDKGGGE